MMKPNLQDDTQLGAWLRQHDPVDDISPARLASLSERILQKTAMTPLEVAAPLTIPLPAISRAQKASLMMGGLIMLMLGLFIGQSVPSDLTQFVSQTEAPAPLLTSPWFSGLK